MLSKIRRGIPAYLAEVRAADAPMFPDNVWDNPVLVDLQNIACMIGQRALSPVQADDVIRQVGLRAAYLRAAALVADAIAADLVAHVACSRPAPPAPATPDMPPTPLDATDPLHSPSPARIDPAPAGVEGAADVSPADDSQIPVEVKPRGRRGR